MEQRIAQVWAECLKRRSIAREDNFFDIGATACGPLQWSISFGATFHCDINDLYEHPRLADFAGVCRPRPSISGR